MSYQKFPGVLIDFISIPVTVGFTSATSVIIMTSQLKSLLGLKINSSTFMDTIPKVIKNLHNTKLADFSLGIICIAVLMALRVSSSMLIIGFSPRLSFRICYCSVQDV